MVVTKYSAQDTGLVCGTVGAVVIDDSSVAWEDRWAGCQPARSPSTELNLCAKRVREHVGRFGVLMVSSMRGTSQTLHTLAIKPTPIPMLHVSVLISSLHGRGGS